MFSDRHRYILKLLAHLADGEPDTYTRMSDLSEFLDIPRGYLNQIVPELVDHGLITSKKGKGGGVKLAEHPSDIEMKALLEQTGALLHRTEDSYEACCIPEDFDECMIDLWMKDFKENVLGDSSLEDLTDRLKN